MEFNSNGKTVMFINFSINCIKLLSSINNLRNTYSMFIKQNSLPDNKLLRVEVIE